MAHRCNPTKHIRGTANHMELTYNKGVWPTFNINLPLTLLSLSPIICLAMKAAMVMDGANLTFTPK